MILAARNTLLIRVGGWRRKHMVHRVDNDSSVQRRQVHHTLPLHPQCVLPRVQVHHRCRVRHPHPPPKCGWTTEAAILPRSAHKEFLDLI